ncbi:hypothetical protein RhiirA5_467166 [Rhizophagus irregularis]|uniref:Uncharacterized protein n=3 Tax=Rhizophagus irregularis TaxID=588596 RepID=A0A2I1E5P3_9GLOM|nr:hypothetical protein RirG_220660 [Rhizophagus irregularis DAOM 197198w]PKC11557.1 hypothetical protein RhiirA5_467166 [Rhizophagus irregularis]GBC33278.1 hypothetical protein RIR_jg12639.t1 [Rhizophagus irregularis DAOM 181602=DAOM 197198]PKC76506.1 hypothetical protein RhiirA1_447562 [Rhizophagus irregularis]PKY17441.1 hypothetical protein RhiirB3_521999 [Rhizophagus irregularis]
MASSNKEDSSIINTTTKSSSNQSNAIREDSQQQQQHTEYNTETDSIQEYEPFLNDEHIEYRTETDSNSRLSNVGDKVVETVKHGVCSVLGTTDKSNQEQKTQRPLTANRSNSPSSKIAQKEISEIEEEYLFVVSRSEY